MMDPLTLASDFTGDLAARLAAADAALAQSYPGDSRESGGYGDPGRRQPVHTVYGGAHLFRADAAARLGAHALDALAEHAPLPADLARALGLPQNLSEALYPRIADKLRREPVEDFRIDFEDGYGNRPDAEEDAHARAAAAEVVLGMEAASLPPSVGIRIKPLSAELAARAIRTLDLFLTTVAARSGGRLPTGFVVTLPKVKLPAQVSALVDLCDRLEGALALAPASLRLEIMVETTQAILDERGQVHLRRLVEAGRGRVAGAHFGTYDYTAACGITAAHQTMDHPACDFARHLMQAALAGTGVWLSDGATNVLPIAPHSMSLEGPHLSAEQQATNKAAVHAAWRLHYGHVSRSLAGGFYQGWDLHPAQLPTRYAAVYAFYRSGLEAASERLRNFVEHAGRATLAGSVFDDAATGQGLLNFFLRAIQCGAIGEEEALARTGLTLDELRGRSFAEILRRRR
ncbi:MAG TPA: aldolase/citrate lyase family protein [Thermoanaerobaculia bacterium]|nr:aldolase/citrate lyase family protein [Thermoanaerobaculia bacterium]